MSNYRSIPTHVGILFNINTYSSYHLSFNTCTTIIQYRHMYTNHSISKRVHQSFNINTCTLVTQYQYTYTNHSISKHVHQFHQYQHMYNSFKTCTPVVQCQHMYTYHWTTIHVKLSFSERSDLGRLLHLHQTHAAVARNGQSLMVTESGNFYPCSCTCLEQKVIFSNNTHPHIRFRNHNNSVCYFFRITDDKNDSVVGLLSCKSHSSSSFKLSFWYCIHILERKLYNLTAVCYLSMGQWLTWWWSRCQYACIHVYIDTTTMDMPLFVP